MIHIIALGLGLVVAFTRGGRLVGFGSVRLHLGWLVLAAFGLQLAVVYLPQLQAGEKYQLPATLIVLSYLMLLAAVLANRHIAGMKLIGIGLVLNFIVMVANGGFMPIAPDAAADLGLVPPGTTPELGMRVARSKDILLAPGQTALWVLSDVFVTSRLIPIKTVFSIGDAVSAIGLFLAIQRAMVTARGAERQLPLEGAPQIRLGD